MRAPFAIIQACTLVSSPEIDDKSDSWVDLHNPNGVECDDSSPACLLQTSAGSAIDVTEARDGQPLTLKLESADNKCVKLKKDHKIEDEGCDSSKLVLCQSHCAGNLT